MSDRRSVGAAAASFAYRPITVKQRALPGEDGPTDVYRLYSLPPDARPSSEMGAGEQILMDALSYLVDHYRAAPWTWPLSRALAYTAFKESGYRLGAPNFRFEGMHQSKPALNKNGEWITSTSWGMWQQNTRSMVGLTPLAGVDAPWRMTVAQEVFCVPDAYFAKVARHGRIQSLSAEVLTFWLLTEHASPVASRIILNAAPGTEKSAFALHVSGLPEGHLKDILSKIPSHVAKAMMHPISLTAPASMPQRAPQLAQVMIGDSIADQFASAAHRELGMRFGRIPLSPAVENGRPWLTNVLAGATPYLPVLAGPKPPADELVQLAKHVCQVGKVILLLPSGAEIDQRWQAFPYSVRSSVTVTQSGLPNAYPIALL